MSLFQELKRRNVLRVAAAYTVTAWLIIQVAETILPHYGMEHHVRTVITVLAIGLLPAIILAWALEWTPSGIRRDAGPGAETASESAAANQSARKLDRIVIVILTVALVWFVYDKLVPAAPDTRHSIAVLPFANEAPEEIPDYLADGLAGEVLDLLAKIPELLVISRSSAFSFEGQEPDLPAIRQRLGVSHVLTGVLTRLGERMQVNASLFDVASGAQAWSQTYVGGLSEIASLQEVIARDVLASLEMQNVTSLPSARQTTPEVAALTLQAKQVWYSKRGQNENMGDDMAVLLEEALRLDPDHVPAMVWMIYANWERLQMSAISVEEENRRRLALSARILAIEPENANVHNLFGMNALFREFNPEAAAASYARALKSAPNDAEVLRHVSYFAFVIGRAEAGLRVIDRAMAVDPLCSMCLYRASKLYMYAGDLDKAIELRQRFITLHDMGHYQYGIMQLLRGDRADALATFEKLKLQVVAEPPDDGRAYAGLAMALHDLGRSAESDEQLQILIERFGEQNPGQVAQPYAWRGDRDEAFQWLSKWLSNQDGRSPALVVQILLDPVYRKLHDDPRWAALREELGLPESRLAAIDFALPTQFTDPVP